MSHPGDKPKKHINILGMSRSDPDCCNKKILVFGFSWFFRDHEALVTSGGVWTPPPGWEPLGNPTQGTPNVRLGTNTKHPILKFSKFKHLIHNNPAASLTLKHADFFSLLRFKPWTSGARTEPSVLRLYLKYFYRQYGMSDVCYWHQLASSQGASLLV